MRARTLHQTMPAQMTEAIRLLQTAPSGQPK